MPEDKRSDEDLITTHKAGDPAALDILCQRYYEHIYYFLVNESLIREASFIEDIRQEVFLTICKLIKSGVFTPQGEGSFKAYLFATAKNICRNSNYWRGKEPKDIYGKLLTLIPAKIPPSPDEKEAQQDALKIKLLKVLVQLSPEEQKLFYYLSKDRKKHDIPLYQEILADPLFAEYSVTYLKVKIYNTRQKAQKLFMEEVDDEKE